MLKAIKLVYLADRESISRYGFPIQSETRVSMEHGPVNSTTYNYLKGEVRDHEKAPWLEFLESVENNRVSLSRRDLSISDLDELSEADLTALEAIWDEFGSYQTWDLVDWTHDPKNLPEWEDPGKSSKVIPLRRIMQNVGVTNPQAHVDRLQDEKRMNALFDRLV
ncbi:hypothetical protein PSJ8397_01201 [Pseudooctadecabacter jejudonensis]|uniref:Antitoxin SocA-like Panacea domain-containing protein n=2 Tax=Pseudooctadecabacter jejudonensis TaxID=1391910 RepID=A0A1Y5S013_9RHOB|nr:hypothetical protein PSJ8397_01201 [Pseudooctadecabacter jejudonensis]